MFAGMPGLARASVEKAGEQTSCHDHTARGIRSAAPGHALTGGAGTRSVKVAPAPGSESTWKDPPNCLTTIS